MPEVGPEQEGTSRASTLQPSQDSTPPAPPDESKLPFSRWWPIVAGAMVGLALRLIYSGEPGGTFAAMSASFIYLTPMVVGAVTVYLAERIKRRTWLYYMSAAFLANVLFVLGTMLVLVEGLICAIVIVPLLALVGVVGGLLMGAVCRWTGWPGRTLCCVMVLPLVLGGVEPTVSSVQRVRTVERSITIAAAPAQVWHTIQHATDIQPEEVEDAWLYRIGVPLPLAGVTTATPTEKVRRITMGKSVHFDQVIVEWQEQRLMRVQYRYQPDSFPPYAMDEHVVLGGHYFDVEGTDYELTPRGKDTQLTIRLQYRVSTPFNWYADPFARMLFRNFEGVILEFYRRRSEREEGMRG